MCSRSSAQEATETKGGGESAAKEVPPTQKSCNYLYGYRMVWIVGSYFGWMHWSRDPANRHDRFPWQFVARVQVRRRTSFYELYTDDVEVRMGCWAAA